MHPKAISVIGVLAIAIGWWLYRREDPTVPSRAGNPKQPFVDSIDPGMIIAPGRAVDPDMVVKPDRNVDPKMIIVSKLRSRSGLQKSAS